MARTLRKVLVELAEDPSELEKFKNDPQSYLYATDLEEDEKEALIAGDKDKIAEKLAVVGGGGTVFTLVISLVLA